MKKDSPIYLGAFLAITAAIAGGALAFANNMTAPVIAANAEKEEKKSLLEMYPDASLDEFQVVDASAITAENNEVEGVYTYNSGDANIVIFKCSVPGYDGGTTFLVGINAEDTTVSAFKAISNGDTKGLGSQIMDAPFAESLIGKDAAGQLDTISGATITSTPVVEAINKCAVLAAEVE